MDDVADNFDDAAVAAEDIGKDRIVAAARAGARTAELVGDTGDALRKASTEAQKGNMDVANSHIRDVKETNEVIRRERSKLLSPENVSSRL